MDMEISYVTFSAAVIRKLWTLQKKNRILKKAIVFFVILSSIIWMWWFITRKNDIMLLLAPKLIQQRVAIEIARDRVRKVVGDFAGMPEVFRDSSAVWAPGCNVSRDAKPPLLLVVVASTVAILGHDEGARRRHVIRRGWAATQVFRSQLHSGTGHDDSNPTNDVQVLFFTGIVNGLSLKTNIASARLHLEMKAWKDIVQVPLADDVAPAVYQHTMALKWVQEQCPRARYLLKVDDDVRVNLRDVLHMLRATLPQRSGAQGLLLCVEKCPSRSWRMDGWLVPHVEKPCYCDGKAVLYSNDVVSAIYYQVLEARRFPKKEVQLTGLFRVRANVTLTPLESRALDGDASPEILRAVLSDARVPASESLDGVPPKEASHSRVLFAHQPGAIDDLDWLWTRAL